ncbi:YbhB/YbcL family Raf kinase inhibitor-like protein [Intrasporangium sp.]|uniref:YbhB/YbcL family Raf kinase inhibitor-like protein n=1 Tax=Intrasporangium sp. TaxID=1925024 RepID=UPI00293AE61D|nr:YbhB/YbcL family Raf kinase inhibitor-like protein [Intrasporangium sp.]MDV3222127.1 YbhB/YbcL family Raf kinase inhibitor-like protein [Intrasporangium sp.]
MQLTSSSFAPSQEIPQKYGKRADNTSPQLAWTDAPAGTRSFALTVVDWHPVAQGYIHWMVCELPATTSALDEGAASGAMPPGARQVRPYAGPFPPSGTHDYEFTLYALDVERLDVPDGAPLDAFMSAAQPHTLATATLVGRFTRQAH